MINHQRKPLRIQKQSKNMGKDGDKKPVDLKSHEGLSDFFSDLDEDDAIDGDYDQIDQYIDEVMAYLENYGNITGGLVTLNAISEFLRQRRAPNITMDACFEIIARLRVNKVILDEVTYDDLPDFYLYIFKEIVWTKDMAACLKLFIGNKQLTQSAIGMQMQWDPATTARIVSQFRTQGLMIERGEFLSIPGLDQ